MVIQVGKRDWLIALYPQSHFYSTIKLHKLQSIREQLRPFLTDKDHPLESWHELMYRFTDFWVDASAMIRTENLRLEDVKSLLDSGFGTCKDIEDGFEKAGSYCGFRIRPGQTFYPLIGHEHVYPSLLAARVWNDRRTATILLYTALARTLQLYSTDESTQRLDDRIFQQDMVSFVHERLQETAREILAAVPQMLESLKKKTHGALSIPNPQQLTDASLVTLGFRL